MEKKSESDKEIPQYTPENGWEQSIASRDSKPTENPRKYFDTEDENDLRSDPKNFEQYDENKQTKNETRTPGL